MKLILTRHGETVENKEHILQAHLPGQLSELGKKQAEQLAVRLASEKLDVIYTSDLARAADTARVIAQKHPDVPLHTVKELRERNHGDFQGKCVGDINWDEDTQRKFNTLEGCPEDGESWNDVFERVGPFLHELVKTHTHETVLLVGHGGVNKVVLCLAQKKDRDDFFKVANFKNTSVTVLEIDEDKQHNLVLLDCVKHL